MLSASYSFLLIMDSRSFKLLADLMRRSLPSMKETDEQLPSHESIGDTTSHSAPDDEHSSAAIAQLAPNAADEDQSDILEPSLFLARLCKDVRLQIFEGVFEDNVIYVYDDTLHFQLALSELSMEIQHMINALLPGDRQEFCDNNQAFSIGKDEFQPRMDATIVTTTLEGNPSTSSVPLNDSTTTTRPRRRSARCA